MIDGRAHVDGGVAMNLPLEPALAVAEPPFDCIALDLFPLGGKSPDSLGEAGERVQNLIFGLQSQRMLRQATMGRDRRILHVPYRAERIRSAAKPFDYSRESLRLRWRAGEQAMERALAWRQEGVTQGAPDLIAFPGP
jgi:NTE family protein